MKLPICRRNVCLPNKHEAVDLTKKEKKGLQKFHLREI